jgi:hypothetical protein
MAPPGLAENLDRRCTVTRLLPANLTEMYAQAVSCLEGLIAQVASQTPSAGDFNKARTALEALPLSTEEAGTARNRLENARTYVQAGERGAACYELCLLAGSLTPRLAAASKDGARLSAGRARPETGPNG